MCKSQKYAIIRSYIGCCQPKIHRTPKEQTLMSKSHFESGDKIVLSVEWVGSVVFGNAVTGVIVPFGFCCGWKHEIMPCGTVCTSVYANLIYGHRGSESVNIMELSWHLSWGKGHSCLSESSLSCTVTDRTAEATCCDAHCSSGTLGIVESEAICSV